MKIRILLPVFMVYALMAEAQWDDYVNMDFGSFRDERDGQEYDWVKIGQQIWMADNLNIGSIILVVDGKVTDGSVERYCYDDEEENCVIYGGLYPMRLIAETTPEEKSTGICPPGWHLPSESEWKELFSYLGGQKEAGDAMKEAGSIHWKRSNKGATNSSGFTALPGGYCLYNDTANIYQRMGRQACFWSSTPSYYLAFFKDFRTFCLAGNDAGIVSDWNHGRSAHSVRCIKD